MTTLPVTIPRFLGPTVRRRLQESPAVVILGPRQVGKTTLARAIGEEWAPGAVYLDLERPADARRMEDADAYLRTLLPRLGVIDEAQRLPELFPILRGVIDDHRLLGSDAGQFLLLGSAWIDLVMRTSDSLAGRVSVVELTGVNVDEAAQVDIDARTLWVRGGFPRALLAADDTVSLRWRTDLIQSYLERDVAMFAPRVPSTALRRMWTMLAHNTGGLFNASQLGANLGLSNQTVSRYVDLLGQLGLTRRLEPWFTNAGKRVTKSPKIYVRDSGLLHALLELETLHDVLGHPSVGASFESFAVESLVNATPRLRPHFYRTARGDEIDLVLVRGGQPQIAVEIKLSTSPTISAGFFRACDDLDITRRYLVHPDSSLAPYQRSGVTVVGLLELVTTLRNEETA